MENGRERQGTAEAVPNYDDWRVLVHYSPQLIQNLEAEVGIERFMLCFPGKKSHITASSQGYSATTRLLPIPTHSLLPN